MTHIETLQQEEILNLTHNIELKQMVLEIEREKNEELKKVIRAELSTKKIKKYNIDVD